MVQPDPIAFEIFGFEIRWYGILIAFGMFAAVMISSRRAPSHGIKEDDVLDLALWMLPAGVIGARMYYVLFNLDYYHSLGQMLDIRSGGLAIHGGLIFGFIAVVLVCRHKNISVLNMADLIVPTVALAQAIGRWGNFFNGEAHGGPTDLPWAIVVDGVRVHPTFLYESIWCLILFFALSYYDKKIRVADGQTLALYMMFYSLERIMVEGLRTDSLMIGQFKQAQVFSLFAMAAGMFLYLFVTNKARNSNNDK